MVSASRAESALLGRYGRDHLAGYGPHADPAADAGRLCPKMAADENHPRVSLRITAGGTLPVDEI